MNMPLSKDVTYEKVIEVVARLISFNLSHYQQSHLERRIQAFMSRYKILTYKEFLDALDKDPKLIADLKDMLTVNVSEFFRNPERFNDIERILFKPAVEGNGTGRLSIWSAGCSIGAEIYSLGLLLAKHNLLSKTRLLATDIDNQIIATAKAGVYPKKRLQNVPEALFKKYFFEKAGEPDTYEIAGEIKRAVTFRNHDLLKSPFEVNFNLILCRNVIIYFNEPAKIQLFEKFHKSLAPGGLMCVGSTEKIPSELSDKFKQIAPFLYSKV